jgi:hypothetical protein
MRPFGKSLYHSDIQNRKAKGAGKGVFQNLQRRLRYNLTAAPLHHNGGWMAWQRRLRYTIKQPPLHHNGASAIILRQIFHTVIARSPLFFDVEWKIPHTHFLSIILTKIRDTIVTNWTFPPFFKDHRLHRCHGLIMYYSRIAAILKGFHRFFTAICKTQSRLKPL